MRHSASRSGSACRRDWLNTLGNLTLTGYNSEYSDRPFGEKRDMQGGFKESPLRLNEGLLSVDTWDEDRYPGARKAARGAGRAGLGGATRAVARGTGGGLPPEGGTPPAGYTLDDHPYLAEDSPMRSLFEEFRKEVLALDPCVREEILKIYVAYKSETNFVDVVPQKSRLRLSLNMHFHELHDPKGLAKDVTNIGRWGNGNIEVGLSEAKDMPYIMGLVRQAFEKQMGNGEAEA